MTLQQMEDYSPQHNAHKDHQPAPDEVSRVGCYSYSWLGSCRFWLGGLCWLCWYSSLQAITEEQYRGYRHRCDQHTESSFGWVGCAGCAGTAGCRHTGAYRHINGHRGRSAHPSGIDEEYQTAALQARRRCWPDLLLLDCTRQAAPGPNRHDFQTWMKLVEEVMRPRAQLDACML